MADRKRKRQWLKLGGGLVILLGLALLASACPDDGDLFFEETPTPFLILTPEASPTVTPAAIETPAATPTPAPAETPTPLAAQVTPVSPFLITVDEAVNIREGPSTSYPILRGLYKGYTETVIGETAGEEVEPGNSIWYQLEKGGFIYSGLVTKIEGTPRSQ